MSITQTGSHPKQGHALSLTLFAISLTDLTKEIKASNCGIMCGREIIRILLFADDIVLLSPSEEKQMLSDSAVKMEMCNDCQLKN